MAQRLAFLYEHGDAFSLRELGMEGCEPAELDAIVEALRARCLARSDQLVGMVFDPEGFTEGVDWDASFVSGEPLDRLTLDTPFPALIALPRARLQGVLGLPAGVNRQDQGEVWFFSDPRRVTEDSRRVTEGRGSGS